jgi:hypothetical protein
LAKQERRHTTLLKSLQLLGVLVVLCDTWNYRVFMLYPSDIMEITEEHNVSETGSVSFLR